MKDTLGPPAAGKHMFYPPNGTVSTWIADQFPPGYVGYCIDVGASDGMSINSTYLLEKQHRWTVLSVEANPYYKHLLNECRAFVKMCAVAESPSDGADFHINLDNLEAYSSLKPSQHPKLAAEAGERWATTKVNVRTLDQLLAECEFPSLDALCIDTEGTEPDVLRGFDIARWQPRVILVESWDAGALDEQLKEFGYERVWRSADNDAYICRETVPRQWRLPSDKA
jgi:FkbM family methyltransferase